MQLRFQRGSNLRKAAGIVHKVAKEAVIQGWSWIDRTLHEHEVQLPADLDQASTHMGPVALWLPALLSGMQPIAASAAAAA